MGAYGDLLGPMAPYGDLWVTLGNFGDLWASMGTHGALRGPMGNHGDLWGQMGNYGDPLGPIATNGDLLALVGTHDDLWGLAGVDVIGEIVRDFGRELLTNSAQRLRVVRWPRLLESLSATSSGRPILDPVSTWDEARQSLLHSATARALEGALLRR